jgi:Protein of unknown function (DUF2752)
MMSHEFAPKSLPQRLSTVEQRQRLLYLGLVGLPLLMSWLNGWGIHVSLGGCPLLKWIGVPCMGWGLTRSFYATAQGDFATAAHFHLFGPLFFIGFAIATLHWSIELLRRQKTPFFRVLGSQRQPIWLFSFLIILGYHLTRLAALYRSGQLLLWVQESIVGRWV